MSRMPLDQAVSEIHQIVQQEGVGKPSPFFFMVGAGISNPEVPLAGDIEKLCRVEAQKYSRLPEPLDTRPMTSYSQWFKRGYPSAGKRQQYLQDLMEDTKISRANVRLAHLVLSRKVARTVFTTNFDDMLSKALELFGERPLVCDHPLTVRRMRIDAPDLQIIHVHGSYWFYDCCNLASEIMDRSGSAPMSVMLDQFLLHHSPLVVGYSGWEGDVLMSSLKRRMAAGGLETPLYWFCYREDAIAVLPEWLKSHPDVNFVVPDEQQPPPSGPVPQDTATPLTSVPLEATSKRAASPEATKAAAAGAATSSDSLEARTKPADTTKYDELSAERVFQAIIEQFALDKPPLVDNPLDFFAQKVGRTLRTDPEEATSKYYDFQDVVERLARARDRELPKGPASLKPLRDAMAKADHRGAIKIAGGIDFVALPSNDRREALFTLMEASLGLYDNSPEELTGYEMVARIGDLIAKQGLSDSDIRERVARAMFLRAATLENLHRNEEALAIYSGLADRFSGAQETSIREQVAKALFSKGAILNRLNRYQDAIVAYDELEKQFGTDEAQVVQENLAKGIFNKGWTLVALDQNQKGADAYTDLLERFANATEPGLREQVAKALLSRGGALGTLGRPLDEIADYDELLRRFADAPEPALRERVAKGLLNKGVTLAALKRNEEALESYSDLVRRFGSAEELVIREQLAKALFNKGLALANLDRSEDEILSYDEVLHRFLDAPEPALQEQVASTLFNKGITIEQLHRSEEAMQVYDELIRRFGDAKEPAIRDKVAKAFIRKGAVYEATGDPLLATNMYREIVIRFGDSEDATLTGFVSAAKAKLDTMQNVALPESASQYAHGALTAGGHV